jgi:hypothetical protein
MSSSSTNAALKDIPSTDLLEELGSRGCLYSQLLRQASTMTVLDELARRGGHPGALAKAALLAITKSQDYNDGQRLCEPTQIDRSAYFPFGPVSYAQMLHVKAMRFVSLAAKELRGDTPNFECLRDTALDLINYAGFYLVYSEGAE